MMMMMMMMMMHSRVVGLRLEGNLVLMNILFNSEVFYKHRVNLLIVIIVYYT